MLRYQSELLNLRVRDARKQVREAQCLSSKGRKGAVADNAVRMIAKYVLPMPLELHGTM